MTQPLSSPGSPPNRRFPDPGGTLDKLSRNQADKWDSGRIPGSNAAFIGYGGAPLRSGGLLPGKSAPGIGPVSPDPTRPRPASRWACPTTPTGRPPGSGRARPSWTATPASRKSPSLPRDAWSAPAPSFRPRTATSSPLTASRPAGGPLPATSVLPDLGWSRPGTPPRAAASPATVPGGSGAPNGSNRRFTAPPARQPARAHVTSPPPGSRHEPLASARAGP